jgi:hypothetical protein
VPGGRRLELHYDQRRARYDGNELGQSLYAKRFDGPYARAALGEKIYTIRHAGMSLTLNARGPMWIRSGDGIPIEVIADRRLEEMREAALAGKPVAMPFPKCPPGVFPGLPGLPGSCIP